MMKNNKNEQNLVVLWTYECGWTDVEVDPQSQMKLKGLQMRMELQVCQRVKYQYLQSYEYKLIEHEERYQYQYMNNINFSQTMSSGWNRKEMYMLKEDNMTRHIKFLSYWIKTTIPLFTFTITQKDTNSGSRGQLTTFYMRTKNETSTTKDSK